MALLCYLKGLQKPSTMMMILWYNNMEKHKCILSSLLFIVRRQNFSSHLICSLIFRTSIHRVIPELCARLCLKVRNAESHLGGSKFFTENQKVFSTLTASMLLYFRTNDDAAFKCVIFSPAGECPHRCKMNTNRIIECLHQTIKQIWIKHLLCQRNHLHLV